jgi:hypothetical protein
MPVKRRTRLAPIGRKASGGAPEVRGFGRGRALREW